MTLILVKFPYYISANISAIQTLVGYNDEDWAGNN